MSYPDSTPDSNPQQGSPELLDGDRRDSILLGLAETMPALVAIFRLSDLKLAHLNRVARKRLNPDNRLDLFQLTLPEIVGLSSLQLLQAEVIPQVKVLGRWAGECVLRDGWGSEFLAKVMVVLPSGRGREKSHLCLFAQEVVRSEEARETPFTDRHLLHELLNHAQDSIYFKDAESRFVRISRFQASKCGLSDPTEAIGKSDFDLFAAEHASAAYADEQRIMKTGVPMIDQEEKETFDDGRTTWASTTKLPLYDENGRAIGTFGISRDITTRKRAEQTQRELESQLQLGQKLESIGRLAAGVAHEVNTPTQFIADNTRFLADAFSRLEKVISLYRELRTAAATSAACAAPIAEVVRAEQEHEIDYLLAEIPRCVHQSQEGLARVSRIVCSLKEFAHPNSPELAPVDLNHVIETVLAVCRHEWKYVAEVVTELDPALPLVPCVVDEFNQVMLNLVINAAHAIADALKIRGGDRGQITVRTIAEEKFAVVEVEDTGTGIPPEIRDRIFEPFFTTKPVGRGTGQGLAIVHNVVLKHHRGTIELTTEPGRGTKFIVRLPLENSVPAATPAQPASLP